MPMNNTTKRILLFLIAFPLLGALVFLLPHYNHLAANLVVILVTILSTRELGIMFAQAGFGIKTPYYPLLSGLFPLLQYLIVSGFLEESAMTFLIVLLTSINLIYPVFKHKNIKKVIKAVSTVPVAILLLIYPAVFFSFIVRFSSFPHASYFLFFFILLVYMNDSNAWLFGMLFGKKKNLFAVSPAKSREGFIGGFFASLVISFAFLVFFPRYIDGLEPGHPLLALALGLVCGFTTIVGDLAESALKRFTNVKDSGAMIMGRGGLLDSVDSLLITAPVFYYFISFYLGMEF
ncbi:MAG: phosphatidate cytidylyltransferase [Spirochaetales bacterium]|nr:phosphatidate cytidylyltransferase [Spirochaetales bacterium]